MRFRDPLPNEIKYKRRFAFFPKYVEKQKIWLEFYFEECKWYDSQKSWCIEKTLLKESMPTKLHKALK